MLDRRTCPHSKVILLEASRKFQFLSLGAAPLNTTDARETRRGTPASTSMRIGKQKINASLRNPCELFPNSRGRGPQEQIFPLWHPPSAAIIAAFHHSYGNSRIYAANKNCVVPLRCRAIALNCLRFPLISIPFMELSTSKSREFDSEKNRLSGGAPDPIGKRANCSDTKAEKLIPRGRRLGESIINEQVAFNNDSSE